MTCTHVNIAFPSTNTIFMGSGHPPRGRSDRGGRRLMNARSRLVETGWRWATLPRRQESDSSASSPWGSLVFLAKAGLPRIDPLLNVEHPKDGSDLGRTPGDERGRAMDPARDSWRRERLDGAGPPLPGAPFRPRRTRLARAHAIEATAARAEAVGQLEAAGRSRDQEHDGRRTRRSVRCSRNGSAGSTSGTRPSRRATTPSIPSPAPSDRPPRGKPTSSGFKCVARPVGQGPRGAAARGVPPTPPRR